MQRKTTEDLFRFGINASVYTKSEIKDQQWNHLPEMILIWVSFNLAVSEGGNEPIPKNTALVLNGTGSRLCFLWFLFFFLFFQAHRDDMSNAACDFRSEVCCLWTDYRDYNGEVWFKDFRSDSLWHNFTILAHFVWGNKSAAAVVMATVGYKILLHTSLKVFKNLPVISTPRMFS